MKTVELFCGTKSFSKFMQSQGHKTFTVDYDKQFDPDLELDISQMIINEDYYVKELKNKIKLLKQKIEEADIIWMSPPCTTFSIASGNKHWTINKEPKTSEAIKGKDLLEICQRIANYCIANNKIFFIENPVGRARWFMQNNEIRHTIWYCQYGDTRAKPTDIWTNLPNWNHKSCKNNNPNCNHERAPRGSKTGTQGLKGSKERGQIPQALFSEIYARL